MRHESKKHQRAIRARRKYPSCSASAPETRLLPSSASQPPRAASTASGADWRAPDWQIACALALAAICLFWLGNGSHSLWDRDEPRYATATREMIERGDYAVPTFNGINRYDKPILIYWLMAVPMRLFGANEFSARAVAGLAGAANILLVFLLARRLGCRRRTAAIAAAAAALSPLIFIISKAATTDSVLVLTVLAAMFLHEEQRRMGFSWARHLGFWAVMALSILVKGPVGPAVVGLGALMWGVWERRAARRTAHREFPYPSEDNRPPFDEPHPRPRPSRFLPLPIGVLLLLAITLPWAWLAWQRTEGEFFFVSIGRHVIERASRSLESHKGPFVYYLPVLLAALAPILAPGLAALRWAWRERSHSPALRFLWSWLVPGFVMFSAAKTKLPHYIAPLLPAMFLMFALWWEETGGHGKPSPDQQKSANGVFPWRGWWRVGAAASLLFGIAAAAGIPVAIWRTPFNIILAPALVMAAALGVGFIGAGWLWWRGNGPRGTAFAMIGWAAALLTVLLWGLPRLEPLRPSKNLMTSLRAEAPPAAHLMAVDFQEPTLVFYWGARVEMMGRDDYAKGIRALSDASAPAALVCPEGRWKNWTRRWGKPLPPCVRIISRSNYYDFQKGRPLDLLLICNWPPPPPGQK